MSLPLKKTFTGVYWNNQNASVNMSSLTLQERYFFDSAMFDIGNLGPYSISTFFLPEGIRFTDLMAFQGKKTKVTIEVVD